MATTSDAAVTASGFSGRLFGPGYPGAGVPVRGAWHGDTLALRADGIAIDVPAQALHTEAAGFNVQQVRLSWRTEADEFALFLEQAADKDDFLAGAPASLSARLGGIKKRQRSVDTRFRAGVFAYVLFLLLPVIAVIVFLLKIDAVAEWVAELVPLRYEEKIGELVLSQVRARGKLIEQGPAYDAVKQIGSRLTADSRYRYQWFVAEGRDVNAFAAPGGVVVVYAGLIDAADSAEELAGVIAHEAAHVEKRHGLKSLIKNAGFGVLLSIALGDLSGSALVGLASHLTELKFSRDAEMEADREGLQRMVKAGIAPGHMADFFEKLAAKEGKAVSTLSILSTHPTSTVRMETLRKRIAALPEKRYDGLDIDWAGVKASVGAR